MQNDKNTLLERLIAKIDNDFNPDNSDWIPRVGAWAIDAMGMIDCLPKKKVRTKYTVQDRIVNVGCGLGDNFKVYDKCGNIIPELNVEDKANERCCFSTGEGEFTVNNVPETIAVPSKRKRIILPLPIRGLESEEARAELCCKFLFFAFTLYFAEPDIYLPNFSSMTAPYFLILPVRRSISQGTVSYVPLWGCRKLLRECRPQ